MEIFVNSGIDKETALKRTTHLAIAAHQDDIEFMAYDGILKCFGNDERWFSGVVVTNGSGSPRTGIYADFTDAQMQEVRKTEQKKAAAIGDYSAQIFLDYSSRAVKQAAPDVTEDIKDVIMRMEPAYIYTHNPADKHDTHVAVAMKVISALRELDYTPAALYGCEAWRGLDWLCDDNKIVMDVSGREHLEAALAGAFDSQIAGGKRYDLAVQGRRRANATFFSSHSVDDASALEFAMDLTPLIAHKELDAAAFVLQYINDFAEDVAARIKSVNK